MAIYTFTKNIKVYKIKKLLLKNILPHRKDLKLIIMSATIDFSIFSNVLIKLNTPLLVRKATLKKNSSQSTNKSFITDKTFSLF